MCKMQNLNCKCITFGFLDTLKVHIQANYLVSTTLSLLQIKLVEKKQQTNFFMLLTSVYSLGTGASHSKQPALVREVSP